MIAKIDHSITKTALVQEIQPYAYVAGQDPLAAAKDSRHDEQMILVDEPRPDGMGGEGGTTHRNIVRQLRLQVANHLRIEFPLETRLRCRDGLERFGIDDLVGRLPDPGRSRSVMSANTSSSGADQSRLPVSSAIKPSSDVGVK